jgi:hypothetical protein
MGRFSMAGPSLPLAAGCVIAGLDIVILFI